MRSSSWVPSAFCVAGVLLGGCGSGPGAEGTSATAQGSDSSGTTLPSSYNAMLLRSLTLSVSDRPGHTCQAHAPTPEVTAADCVVTVTVAGYASPIDVFDTSDPFYEPLPHPAIITFALSQLTVANDRPVMIRISLP